MKHLQPLAALPRLDAHSAPALVVTGGASAVTGKVYRGRRTGGGCVVTVSSARTTAPLPWRLDLRNHSPAGLEWGYCGSGPAQLALALLADVSGSDGLALAWYQRFKAEVVAGLQGDSWELTARQVSDWFARATLTELLDAGDAGRACRVCGCTEGSACLDLATGEPCRWVEADLCSACAAGRTAGGEGGGA